MKKTKFCLMVAGAIILFTYGAKAQKYDEGDKTLSFLRGEKVINLEYTYDDMKVGKKPESQYVQEKTDEYNKKQPGKGDRWAAKWVANRQSVYEPMFEELINKISFKAKMNTVIAQNKPDAKYTLVVHTAMTEPGFNAMVMKVNPSCDFDFIWQETASGKVMAKGYLDHVQGVVMGGSDWDFDPANKIKECYAKAGKEVGKTMEKALAKQ